MAKLFKVYDKTTFEDITNNVYVDSNIEFYFKETNIKLDHSYFIEWIHPKINIGDGCFETFKRNNFCLTNLYI